MSGTSSESNSAPDQERGQSSIEFALIVPVVFVLLLLAAQVGVLIVGQVSVTHAAREVARSLAVDPDASAEEIANSALPFAGPIVDIRVDRRPSAAEDRDIISVTVSAEVPRVVVARWLLPGAVSATAVTLSEH